MALTRTKKAQTKKTSVVESTAVKSDSDLLDQNLRPKDLSQYVGQGKIKEHLMVHIEAAKKRQESLGHSLLHGPPGLGKTTLAMIIAKEMGSQIKVTSGPAVEKPGDLASLLTNLEEGDVLFIDEIHRLRPVIEEVLYTAMEDYALDIIIGKGPTARSMRIDLKPFTLVGATTRSGGISAPLRDRFVHSFKLNFYNHAEMEQIVTRSASILEVEIDDGVAACIASSCRSTPRIANRLVRSVRDFAQVGDEVKISLDRARSTLEKLGIDEHGLDNTDRQILETIIQKFAGGPVGLGTLAASLAEEQESLEDVYEPFLIQSGLLERTPKGRAVTKRAFEALRMEVPKDSSQSSLF